MANSVLFSFFATALVAIKSVEAHDNGMDMSMDGAMSLSSGDMLPYLHFTLGDIVWFQGWVPQSAGAVFGVCVGLFLLAIVDRWVAACRSLMEVHWLKHSRLILANRLNASQSLPQYTEPSLAKGNDEDKGSLPLKSEKPSVNRVSIPFIPSFDIPRAVLQMAQATLEFAFMLVVMTYQVSYIISIIIGLGVGEMLFGRYHSHAHL
ncbi:CTR copper uptake transporter [Pyrrhoderma noxium]|uniref:Copper transport protein n=1 Tax=Pyrrhoderma noxium TaxID=2282107 RepID=A0A286U8S9_9AGAM|nr:CTR copper uptake transporter [Pyrrhoderma noxium]